ncbi:hypothetical protein ACI3ET_01295 [Ornithinimicrobium sp. LYQ121]|uniref:hypothetical protein n=1 Tax=Ornithinimicrobium sp. LYQ121 TaxID=3378801 RepID=UPI003854976C
MEPITEQSGLDTSVLGLYLNDHLAGAAGGRARAHDMAKRHADLPIGPGLVRFASELDMEYARLRRLIDELGLQQRIPRRVAAVVGEKLGRLKLNGHLFTRSPMTPLLEVELMRGAVNAKRGLWQVLRDQAHLLGLDEAEWARLDQLAQDQSARLDEMHALVRGTALRENGPV